ncbi:efflux transporter periplasmic adaptor subunit, partial [Xanthomonas perforans]
VRQGLKAGDKVSVQGLQKASVGAEVRAVEVSQTAAADSAANASPSTQGTAAAAPKAD